MIKDLSASLVAAAAAINAKTREAYLAEQAVIQAKKIAKMPQQPAPKAEPAAVSNAKKMAEAAEGTVPKTPREKELAAKHGNKKLITHGDVMKARGVKREEVEIDEAINDNLHPAGAALLKHIKPEHHNKYKEHLTTDVFNGSYKDRTDVLKAAKNAGHMKEEVERLNEVHVLDDEGETHVHVKDAKNVRELDRAVAHHLKTHHGFSHQDVEDHYHDGYYSEAPYHHEKPEKGSKPTETRTKEEHAKSVAERVAQMKKDSEMDEGWNPMDENHKPGHVGFKKLAAKTSPALAAWIGREKYGKKKFQAMAEKGKKQQAEEVEAVDEGWDDMMKSVKDRSEEEKRSKGTGKFDVKKTSTGTVYTRKSSTFEDGGKDTDMKKADKKAKTEGFMDMLKKIGKKVADTVAPGDEKLIDNLHKSVHGKNAPNVPKPKLKLAHDYVKEEVEELDELSKSTLGSYAKKASRDATIARKIGADFEHQGNRAKSPGMKAASNEMSQKYKVKSWKRRDGVDKAVDRLTKEEVECLEVHHEQFGAGKTLGQFSEDLLRVDVMFAEGIKRVSIDDIEMVEETAAIHPSAIHVSPASNGKYKVHAVGKKFASGIKVGEHLTDTHLDDFSEMGGKIKMVKAPKKD